MKRLLLLAAVVAICVAGIAYAIRKRSQARVGPEALLDIVATAQREATRVPARVTRISDDEEIALGNEMARRPWFGTEAADPALEQYVREVGARLAVRAHRPLPYQFHYVPDSKFENAFALPGGHVYVGKGLIALMDSEDELANVLGHEIEHVDQRHCVERLQVEAAMRKLHLGIAGEIAQLPIELFQAGYSKDQELEADREGMRLAVAAGYSATGAVRMFETFDRQRASPGRRRPRTPQEEAADIAVHTVTGYFRSHPYPDERIAQIKRLLDSDPSIRRQERPLRVRPTVPAPVVPK